MNRSPQRILIVEDRRVFRAALSAELECSGYDVFVTEDEPTAAARIADADVVVVAVDMAAVDGLGLLESIARTGAARSKLVLAVTDASDPVVAARLRDLGVRRVLTRWQFGAAEVRAVIESVGRNVAA